MQWNDIKSLIKNKKNLEIGGPSQLFNENSHLSLYDIIYPKFLVDMISHVEGFEFESPSNKEQTILGDCIDINIWKSIGKTYDCVISSHVLEHIANPIKLLKYIYDYSENFILTIVPDYRYIWDCTRSETTFDHLLQDYVNDISENDSTHIIESKNCHIFGNKEEHSFKFTQNFKYRIVHHHTFIKQNLIKIHEYARFKTIYCFSSPPHHIIYLGQKICL